jgi:hypothetical protein
MIAAFEKLMPLLKGIAKKILVTRKYDDSTGGTNNSRYCYSVWMRHLVTANNNAVSVIPGAVAELGPGDSPGIGFAALLTGCASYHALDVHKFWNTERNLKIFDELVVLLKNKTPVPDAKEFPRVRPYLENYDFPGHIITDERLSKSLAPERIKAIREEISNAGYADNACTHIRCSVPWNENSIPPNSIDFIYTQAVLEYANDLDNTFAVMSKWLKKGGAMSHTVDLSSHGFTKSWNGHWLFSEGEWKLIHGNNRILLNRAPRSTYLNLNKKYNFELLNVIDYTKASPLTNKHFSKKFKSLSPEDVKTNVIVVLSKKVLVFFHLFSEWFFLGEMEALYII